MTKTNAQIMNYMFYFSLMSIMALALCIWTGVMHSRKVIALTAQTTDGSGDMLATFGNFCVTSFIVVMLAFTISMFVTHGNTNTIIINFENGASRKMSKTTYLMHKMKMSNNTFSFVMSTPIIIALAIYIALASSARTSAYMALGIPGSDVVGLEKLIRSIDARRIFACISIFGVVALNRSIMSKGVISNVRIMDTVPKKQTRAAPPADKGNERLSDHLTTVLSDGDGEDYDSE